jgi:ABC-type nitrate/sulfonate/bicarbonate transport system substrate-binding protein
MTLKASLQFTLVLGVCAFLLLFPASSQAQEKKTVRVAFVSLSWHQELPFRIARVKGYFQEQGIAIEPILIRGGPAALAALISGAVSYTHSDAADE